MIRLTAVGPDCGKESQNDQNIANGFGEHQHAEKRYDSRCHWYRNVLLAVDRSFWYDFPVQLLSRGLGRLLGRMVLLWGIF